MLNLSSICKTTDVYDEPHNNHFYYSLLGNLYTGIDNKKALQHYETAMKLATSINDKATIAINIDRLKTLWNS